MQNLTLRTELDSVLQIDVVLSMNTTIFLLLSVIL